MLSEGVGTIGQEGGKGKTETTTKDTKHPAQGDRVDVQEPNNAKMQAELDKAKYSIDQVIQACHDLKNAYLALEKQVQWSVTAITGFTEEAKKIEAVHQENLQVHQQLVAVVEHVNVTQQKSNEQISQTSKDLHLMQRTIQSLQESVTANAAAQAAIQARFAPEDPHQAEEKEKQMILTKLDKLRSTNAKAYYTVKAACLKIKSNSARMCQTQY